MKRLPKPLPLLAAAAALLLSACATYSPARVQPGMDAAQVEQLMGGAPTGRYPGPGGGTRLEYARGPAGLHTYMIDLDPGGRVTGWQQVLTENNFNAITPGMPVREMLWRLGRPAQTRGGGWQPGQVWTYRYDSSPFCLWWQISVVGDVVKDAAYGPDPRCDPPDAGGPR
ncbi:hypothetical protein [Azohydromonas aeria]|uniref:hypothetical protein n=1 Tax=Azohydromonas aeria TaxID=2590212 RepID=UPI0012FB9A31|nr:hypothetical protein [Azohydromonas aeria]